MKKAPTQKQLSQAQILARKKFGEQAKARAGYELTIKFNDQIFTCKTKDIAQALVDLAPARIKTRVHLIIKKGSKTAERLLFVPRAKQLFRNKFFRDLFVRKLNFK